VHEIFSALLHGGTLVLKDEDDPFAHLSHVDAIGVTPSILATLEPQKYQNLRVVSRTVRNVSCITVANSTLDYCDRGVPPAGVG
jgi:hypothetical protein